MWLRFFFFFLRRVGGLDALDVSVVRDCPPLRPRPTATTFSLGAIRVTSVLGPLAVDIRVRDMSRGGQVDPENCGRRLVLGFAS